MAQGRLSNWSLFQLTVDLPQWHRWRIKEWLRGRRNYPLSLVMLEIMGHLVGPFALWRSRRRVKREGLMSGLKDWPKKRQLRKNSPVYY
jgi:hypothetical protein